MERLVIKTPDGLFTVRDTGGKWHPLLDREDVDGIATQAEIREAIQRAEFAKYPLPAFDLDSGMYFWPPDVDDQYDAEEISGDLAKLGWPAECVPLLLELARGCAKLGITD